MPPAQEWNARFSSDVADWYSPLPSSRFDKVMWNVSAPVFVEATEFVDVLLTAGLDVGQVYVSSTLPYPSLSRAAHVMHSVQALAVPIRYRPSCRRCVDVHVVVHHAGRA